MPALFANCPKCNYRFTFDYDLRQQRCQKCSHRFAWDGKNPIEQGSFHSEIGPTDSGERSGVTRQPILPGEPGYQEYQEQASREKRRTVTETDRPTEYWK